MSASYEPVRSRLERGRGRWLHSPVFPATMSRSCSARVGAMPRRSSAESCGKARSRRCRASRSRRSAGHKGTLFSVDADGRAVLVFAGRSHLYEGHPAHTVVHGVRTAVLAGCGVVVLTNAAGGLDPDVPVGTPVLLRDHLNLTGASPMTGDDPPASVRHPVLRSHRGVRRRPACSRAPGRSRPARGGVRRAARGRVRDPGRDPDVAHARRRSRRHVDRARDDRGASPRRTRARHQPRDELRGGHLARSARPRRSAGGGPRRRAAR